MTEENSQEQESAEDVVAYEDMSWQKLKALMTAEGQEWVNAEHAIEYLNKLDEADDSESSDDTDEAEKGSSQETDASTDSDPEKSAEEEDPVPDGTDESTDAAVNADAGASYDNADIADTTDADVVGNDDLVDSPEDEIPCFDPDDKHGVISGQCNARYWQNGCHYDNHGQYIAPEDVVVTPEETD